MTDIPSFDLTKTKHKLLVSDLLNAINGRAFPKDIGLYRLHGSQIDKTKLFNSDDFYFDPDIEYIIVTQAIIDAQQDIHIVNQELKDYQVGFIFYKSILPTFRCLKIKTESWYFYDCKSGPLYFLAFNQINGLRILQHSQIDAIAFSTNSLSKEIKVLQNSSIGSLSLSDYSEWSDIIIGDNCECQAISLKGKSKTGHIYILNNTGVKQLRISDVSSCGKINIEKNSICNLIEISDNSSSTSINISGNSQCDSIIVTGHSLLQQIWAESNKGDLDIDIKDSSQIFKIHIKNGKIATLAIEKNFLVLELINTYILLIKINECLLTSLEWNVGTKCEAYISNSRIELLSMRQTVLLKESIVSFINVEVNYLCLEQLTVQGQLLFRNLRSISKDFNLFNFNSWLSWLGDRPNYKRGIEHWNSKNILLKMREETYALEIENIKNRYGHSSLLILNQSSLGKTEITGCDFSNFKLLYFNSKIVETFIIGTQLPKRNIEIYHHATEFLTNKTIYEQKTSIYHQLKKIFELQGDIVETGWYHSKAMESQQALLSTVFRETKAPFYTKWFSDPAFDLFGFWLNKKSNYHGESWRLALKFTLTSSFLIYSFYYISIHHQETFSINFVGDFIGDYFSFLDISHRIDFHVSKDKLSAFSKFLDYLGKIVIGYSLYQLIIAFRRHGRKS